MLTLTVILLTMNYLFLRIVKVLLTYSFHFNYAMFCRAATMNILVVTMKTAWFIFSNHKLNSGSSLNCPSLLKCTQLLYVSYLCENI